MNVGSIRGYHCIKCGEYNEIKLPEMVRSDWLNDARAKNQKLEKVIEELRSKLTSADKK